MAHPLLGAQLEEVAELGAGQKRCQVQAVVQARGRVLALARGLGELQAGVVCNRETSQEVVLVDVAQNGGFVVVERESALRCSCCTAICVLSRYVYLEAHVWQNLRGASTL